MFFKLLIKPKHIFILFVSLSLVSCGLKPIKSQYSFIQTDLETVDLEKLGDGTVLIYNGSNIFHKIDNTANLNIWIDEKPLGQLQPSEYVIINLPLNNYVFKALHKDIVNMRSEHDVQITENTKIIKIKPNITSNKLEVTNELPKNFDKFKYAVNL